MAQALELPCIDLSSPDRISTAESIRQACLDYGFFYLVNHGIEDEMLKQVFDESRKFFSMPLQKKMRLARSKEHRGYTALYSETLDPSIQSKGDLKESFYIGPMEGGNLNQWPSEGIVYSYPNHHPWLSRIWESLGVLPHWRATMESYHEKILAVGKRLLSLIALALNLDENFFEQVGAPIGWVRLLHYPGELAVSDTGTYGASAHSDYGMITLLATDGVQGLQICREKDKVPRVWEDVPHANGAFIVNIGDMLERWTNCLFRSSSNGSKNRMERIESKRLISSYDVLGSVLSSTLHRVIATGQERYSVAFFLDPNSDCMVECLESCCSEASPPKFPPIRSGDYLQERLRLTYALKG